MPTVIIGEDYGEWATTEPCAELTYGDLTVKIPLTIVHNLRLPPMRNDWFKAMNDLDEQFKTIEKMMWHDIRKDGPDDIRVTVTLATVLARCNDWDKFCEDKGYSVYAVNEGGGDVEVELTGEELVQYGLLPGGR